MNSRLIRAFTLLTALSLAAGHAHALPGDLSSLFPVNDDDPTANLPSDEDRAKNPLQFGYFLQDLIARAEGAFLKKDWANAAKYYEALGKTVPDRAISFSRLCVAYSELGDVDRAAAACRHTLGLGGAQVMDHFRFISLSLRKKRLDARDVADIDASITHLRAFAAAQQATGAASASAEPPSPAASAQSATPKAPSSFAAARAAAIAEASQRRQTPAPATSAGLEQPSSTSVPVEIEVLACKLAVYLKDSQRLTACVQSLKNVKADEKVVLPFEWSQALVSNDHKQAAAILAQAKALKLPERALTAMEAEQGRHLKPTGIIGFLTRGGTGRTTALITTLLALVGGLWWLLAAWRRSKVRPEAQPS